MKSTVTQSRVLRLIWPASNVLQDGPTKRSVLGMEGRCGQLTLAGNKCKNKCSAGGSTTCRMHGPTSQCSVCFSGLTRGTRTLPCGHEFHQKCIDRWKRTCHGQATCPMCRGPFDLPVYRIMITIQNVPEGTIETTTRSTSNVQGIQSEFGLDLRVLEFQPDATMNIMFDLDENEDLRDVLAAIGIPRSV